MHLSGAVLAATHPAVAAAHAAPATVGGAAGGAISISGGVLALLAVWFLKHRKIQKMEWITPWLLLVAGIGFTNSFIGDWIRTGVSVLAGVPYIGPISALVAGLGAFAIFIYDVLPKHPTTKLTGPAAFCLPTVGPAVPGAVGTLIGTLTGGVGHAGGAILAKLVGLS